MRSDKVGGSWLVWDRRSCTWVEHVAPLTPNEVLEILFADNEPDSVPLPKADLGLGRLIWPVLCYVLLPGMVVWVLVELLKK